MHLQILLLDEATSALDSANEAAVTAALAGLTTTHQHTCVVVAHRLSTVQGADVIAVVEAGSVVQQGKHSQLLANKQGGSRCHQRNSSSSSSSSNAQARSCKPGLCNL
jgi:ATP-binding cassette subfamily B (MDR/TAP) protein 1